MYDQFPAERLWHPRNRKGKFLTQGRGLMGSEVRAKTYPVTDRNVPTGYLHATRSRRVARRTRRAISFAERSRLGAYSPLLGSWGGVPVSVIEILRPDDVRKKGEPFLVGHDKHLAAVCKFIRWAKEPGSHRLPGHLLMFGQSGAAKTLFASALAYRLNQALRGGNGAQGRLRRVHRSRQGAQVRGSCRAVVRSQER